MERESVPIIRDDGAKKEDKPLTSFDKNMFEFIPWTYTESFLAFTKFMDEIRDKTNKVDAVMPQIMIDGTRNDIENFGLKTLTMRAKISMLDDIMGLIRSAQIKFEKKKKENENG